MCAGAGGVRVRFVGMCRVCMYTRVSIRGLLFLFLLGVYYLDGFIVSFFIDNKLASSTL
jgi:hypothetical protein